jgi:hypothetical protein
MLKALIYKIKRNKSSLGLQIAVESTRTTSAVSKRVIGRMHLSSDMEFRDLIRCTVEKKLPVYVAEN